ncbi:MAG: hypothetical protein ACOX5G_00675 [Kiritimatiellia bacterium]|jgi:hypothetical protein
MVRGTFAEPSGRGGGAGGGLPPFRVTVPSVDVDWAGFAGPADENGEEARFVVVPLNTNKADDIRGIKLHDPFDEDQRNGRPRFPHGKPVHPDITLHWEAGNPLALLGGTTVYTNKIEIDAREVDWPLDYAVIPRHSAIPFAIAAEGQAAEGGKAVDIVHGRIVDVDLDVDANHDGAITGADEPLEMDPGGLACVCTNHLTPIKLTLQPAGLTGRLTLSATMGGQRIKVWRNANRTGQIDLSQRGNVAPGTLYVEGVTNSAALRDVELRLEYDENPQGQNNPLFKCADVVRLTVIKVDLKEVSFSGTKYHTVKKDDGSQDYTAPHWQDNSSPLDGDADDAGDKKYPICFTRNTKMKVSAKWRIEPSGLGVTIKIKGDGPGNLDFPETTAAISGNDLTITDVECSNPFANEIDFFDPMSISWSYSMDGGSTWCSAGTSANQTYVTLGDPLTTVYHTLVHLGCKNADGENTATNCTSRIWIEFTDRDVRRVDGVQLTYYASYTCGNVTTASLLANGDGQCGAWASLFIDMRKVQGIDDTDEYVIFRPITPYGIPQSYVGFLVKNWTFTGAGTSGFATHPYMNIPDFPLVGGDSYNWKFSEVDDATGIPGQGNANPASLFNNHQVVISGEYYDPSCGIKHSRLQDIDDNAIDGYYIGPISYPVDEPAVNLDLNGDGDKTDLQVDTGVYLIQKNAAGLDIWEQRFDW